MLVHILSIFSGFIAPLVFYLVKKDSPFVAFHALQSLIWHVIYMGLIFLGVTVAIVTLFAGGMMQPHGPGNHVEEPPFLFFGVFGIIWLLAFGGGVINVILGIVYSIKANNGEWARFPVIGNLALRIVLRNRPHSC